MRTSFSCSTEGSSHKYAEKHRVAENNMIKLQEIFEGCHDADMCSGVFAKILEGKKKAKEDD